MILQVPSEEPDSHLDQEVIGPREFCQLQQEAADHIELLFGGRVGEGEA